MASGMGEYGVEVQNRFNLAIDDDVDLYEILKKQEEGRGKAKKDEKQPVKGQSGSKTDKQGPTSAKKPASKPSSASATESGKVQQNGNKGPELAPKVNAEVRSARPPRQRTERAVNFDESRTGEERPPPRRQFDEGGFPSGEARGFRGGGRGFSRGGSSRGFPRGGFNRSENRMEKREYDRHSGSDKTGVKPIDKKEGAGSHNWGTVEDELPEETVATEVPESGQPDDVENQDPNAEQPSVPQDEAAEPHEMTLDEWKAQQDKFRIKAEFNLRKPNEGADSKQWKNTYMLTKAKEPEAEEGSDESEEEEEEVEDTRSALNKLNIKITFNDSDRGYPARRRGRGGRGGERSYDGDRGFRGRGGFSSDTADRPSFPDTNAEKVFRDRPFGERGGRRSFGATDDPHAEQDHERSGFGGEGSFGRGGYRNERARGGGFNRPRGTPRKEAVAPRVDDENDFPALGK